MARARRGPLPRTRLVKCLAGVCPSCRTRCLSSTTRRMKTARGCGHNGPGQGAQAVVHGRPFRGDQGAPCRRDPAGGDQPGGGAFNRVPQPARADRKRRGAPRTSGRAAGAPLQGKPDAHAELQIIAGDLLSRIQRAFRLARCEAVVVQREQPDDRAAAGEVDASSR